MALGLIGCGGGGGGDLPDPTDRFVNASPDANPLDFFIDADKKASALTYLTTSTDQNISSGDRDASVVDSTTSDNLDAQALTFDKDKKYVTLAIGLENWQFNLGDPNDDEPDKRLRLVTGPYTKTTPNGTTARLVIVHAFMRKQGFQTPGIDFQSFDAGNPQAPPLYSKPGIQFASAPVELTVNSNDSIVFQARREGTENPFAQSAATVFDTGGIYLAIVAGIEDAVGSQAPQIKFIKIN